MVCSDEHWLELADRFNAAAIGEGTWYHALEGLAQATGSQIGELIGVGAKAAVPFNIMTNMDSAFGPAFIAAGGGDPNVNPRVGAGLKSPPLKVMADYDFISPDAYKRNAHYQDFARRWDIPFICLATLDKLDQGLIGLAVCRSKRDGYITDAQRRVFASLAPHARAAVRTQIALENQGAKLLAGAMERLSLPAFVCDRTGQVRAMTPAAEKLVADQRGLGLKLGVLRASGTAGKSLDEAITLAAAGLTRPGAPLLRTVVIRVATAEPIVLDVMALPSRPSELSRAAKVLVVARGISARARTTVLRAAYGLTSAEAEVAERVAEGCTPDEIALQRAVSVGTVRIQLKAAMAKLGVRRQAQLVARVGQL